MKEQESLITKQINQRIETIKDEMPKEKEKKKSPLLPKVLIILLGLSVLLSLFRMLS